jgi:hypothetical protein
MELKLEDLPCRKDSVDAPVQEYPVFKSRTQEVLHG